MSDETSNGVPEVQMVKIDMTPVSTTREFYAYVAKHPKSGEEAIVAAGPIEMVADVGPKMALLRIADVEVKLVKYTRTEDLDEVGEAIALRDSRKAQAEHKAREAARGGRDDDDDGGEGKPMLGFQIPQGTA